MELEVFMATVMQESFAPFHEVSHDGTTYSEGRRIR